MHQLQEYDVIDIVPKCQDHIFPWRLLSHVFYIIKIVYNISCKKIEIPTSDFFASHVPGTMPSLSIFIYLDSTHFSENFGISYMVVGILLPNN